METKEEDRKYMNNIFNWVYDKIRGISLKFRDLLYAEFMKKKSIYSPLTEIPLSDK